MPADAAQDKGSVLWSVVGKGLPPRRQVMDEEKSNYPLNSPLSEVAEGLLISANATQVVVPCILRQVVSHAVCRKKESFVSLFCCQRSHLISDNSTMNPKNFSDDLGMGRRAWRTVNAGIQQQRCCKGLRGAWAVTRRLLQMLRQVSAYVVRACSSASGSKSAPSRLCN